MLFTDRPILAHALRVQDLILQVNLGCTAEERSQLQEVRVTIEFRFETAPRATVTDRLEDTICYAEVSEALKLHVRTREYNLIEKLAVEAFEISRRIAGPDVLIGLSLHKVRPPVDGLSGGSWYRCGDFLL